MKTFLQKIVSMMLCVLLACTILPVSAEAGFEIPGNSQVQTDIGTAYAVKTVDHDYERNTYYSLRDIAMALKDTDKSFSLEITKNAIALNPGNAYTPVGGENVPWETGEAPETSLRRNECKINGEPASYYTMIVRMPAGYFDCFMMAADLAMILDVGLDFPTAGSLQIYTQESLHVSPGALEEAGYFYGVNGVLVGDATTGEVYYRYQSDVPCAIASTSKLMTCLLAMEALSAGEISLDEWVTVSEAAQLLSESSDGVIPLEAGGQITVQDLLLGTLLPSSNECALCLAERIAGSEEAFVQRMNQRALELGLSQAAFFNCNGLPCYTEDAIPAKRQNRMSAEDMFRLVSYLLKVYPQVTDITSQKSAVLMSLGREVRNTNPMLSNLPGVTGLKTGTTNKAGACLVTSLTADDGAAEHNLVVVVFGSEDSVERGRVSGLLARYALQAFHTGAEVTEEGAAQASGNLPIQAEMAVDCILRTARRGLTSQ